jgi:formate transporter FocA
MAIKAEDIGVIKANFGPWRMIVLGILAGAFIALGAIFATTVVAGASESLPYGVTRLLSGSVFSLGLILVIVGGAELFTGNNLIIMAWASGRVSTRLVLRNWVYVYFSNFVGAISIGSLIFLSGQYKFGNSAVGLAALNIAKSKLGFSFVEGMVLGVLCNLLVCLAIWLSMSARTTTDRVISIIFPITAFVAAGFEHSIANMYFVPVGIFIKSGAPPVFWESIGKNIADFEVLTWGNFIIRNLIPVTIGNIIGGALLVGAVYWIIYLRRRK